MESATSETPGTPHNPAVSLSWSAAPALLSRIHNALTTVPEPAAPDTDQADDAPEAGPATPGAEHEITEPDIEARRVLEEAKSEAARIRAEIEAERDTAHRLAEGTLSAAQATLDAAMQQAAAIRSEALFKARLIVAAAMSQARLTDEDTDLFSWHT